MLAHERAFDVVHRFGQARAEYTISLGSLTPSWVRTCSAVVEHVCLLKSHRLHTIRMMCGLSFASVAHPSMCKSSSDSSSVCGDSHTAVLPRRLDGQPILIGAARPICCGACSYELQPSRAIPSVCVGSFSVQMHASQAIDCLHAVTRVGEYLCSLV